VGGQDDLAVGGEEHEVGFPVAWSVPAGRRPLGQRDTTGDKGHRGAAAASEPTPPRLGARQIVTPAIVVGATDLGVDEAVDALVADDRSAVVGGQAAGDLLGRPAGIEPIEHEIPQGIIAIEA